MDAVSVIPVFKRYCEKKIAARHVKNYGRKEFMPKPLAFLL